MTSWVDVCLMLKPFQIATAEAAIDGLWRDDTTSRFLVADEVGLGKTLVAKGVIAHLIEKLKALGDKRIDIVYLCSNTSIARQNLKKLREFADDNAMNADRLTKLVAAKGITRTGINVVALTPGTSFTFGHRSGRFDERALLYAVCRRLWSEHRDVMNSAGAKRVFFYGIGDENLALRVSAGCEGKERPVAAADGEEDPQPVVGEGPEAGPDPLDLLDDRVQSFGGPVGGAGGVPGQDLASPSLEGPGHAPDLLGGGVPAVVDEAVDPPSGELGLAVEAIQVTKRFLSVNRPSAGRWCRSTNGRSGCRILDQGGRYGAGPCRWFTRWLSPRW